MQVFITGCNRLGQETGIAGQGDISYEELMDLLKEFQQVNPDAISVTVRIAYPDPEVVAIKHEMMILVQDIGQTDEDKVNALWNTFNIKRRD